MVLFYKKTTNLLNTNGKAPRRATDRSGNACRLPESLYRERHLRTPTWKNLLTLEPVRKSPAARSHQCPQGRKYFASNFQLCKHEINSGESPHKCPGLGKSFLRSDRYRRPYFHIRERPYESAVLHKRQFDSTFSEP